MGTEPAKSALKQRFSERVRWARIARGMTQAEIATLLGIEQDQYKQYEGSSNKLGRTYLPHDLIPRFCIAVGIDACWLFTERGRAPASAEPPAEPARAARGRRRRSRAA